MSPTRTSSFPDQLHNGCRRCGIEPSFRLLLAVSGGADSIALLHGTMKIADGLAASQVVVAHVNHGLRGAASAADAEFVCELAGQLGLPFELLTLDGEQLAAEQGTTLEETARNARYAFFVAAARKHGLNCVATAHQADDQAETVLHHIIRGTGLRGLRGMLPRRALADGVELVRPMLQICRKEVLDYLAAEQRRFRHDHTNHDESFMRNRIRHRLLPLLAEEFNPQVAKNLVTLAEQCEQTLECMDALSERILSEAVVDQQPDIVRLDRRVLANWPVSLVRHALTVLWQRQHWPRQKMTRGHWVTLTGDALRNADFRRDFPGGIRADSSGEVVRLLRKS